MSGSPRVPALTYLFTNNRSGGRAPVPQREEDADWHGEVLGDRRLTEEQQGEACRHLTV
jgi:hypothetical protein